jgi:integrase
LLGLRWTDVDLATGKVSISRQLLKAGREPQFGPTKTRKDRTHDVSADTLAMLREHKRQQAELTLANRLQCADYDLVFGQSWEHQGYKSWQLGAPLRQQAITVMIRRLVGVTGVPRIPVHGLRHTCATLMLAAGVQSKVVQERLGHSNIATTLDL